MATVGQLIYSNENSSRRLYNSSGVIEPLSPVCLTATHEVVAVDGFGLPTFIKPIGATSGGTTPAPIPNNAWLNHNNFPVLDHNGGYILL